VIRLRAEALLLTCRRTPRDAVLVVLVAHTLGLALPWQGPVSVPGPMHVCWQ
jgi:hypothetical protein